MLSLKLRLGVLSAPSGTLTLLRLTSSLAEKLIMYGGGGVAFEEGDGRYVRAPEPA